MRCNFVGIHFFRCWHNNFLSFRSGKLHSCFFRNFSTCFHSLNRYSILFSSLKTCQVIVCSYNKFCIHLLVANIDIIPLCSSCRFPCNIRCCLGDIYCLYFYRHSHNMLFRSKRYFRILRKYIVLSNSLYCNFVLCFLCQTNQLIHCLCHRRFILFLTIHIDVITFCFFYCFPCNGCCCLTNLICFYFCRFFYENFFSMFRSGKLHSCFFRKRSIFFNRLN